MKKLSLHSAFTLIELLVVISIISILAGIAMPVYNRAIMNGKQTAALNSARQIGLALRMYAGDYDGVYPATKNVYDESIVTSNDAFRSLVPSYVDNEKVFTVPGSKAGPSADNKLGTPAQMLARGENHWAYVEGLGTSSNSTWPLVADSTDGSGHYTDREGDLGGLWKGTKAVVVNADNSARLVPLLGSPTKRYVPRSDDHSKNALQVSDYMGDGVKLLEPAR